MRTTITLDPDVDQLLRRAMREHGRSFRETVNEAIRSGLRARAVPPFRQKTVSMGAERHFPWEKALETAYAMEDEEIARKLSLRK